MRNIIFIILLYCNVSLLAQNENTSLLDKEMSFNIFKYWGFMTKEHNIISSGVYCSITNFQNENLQPNAVGIKYGAKLTAFPFIVEGYKFSGKVKIANTNNILIYQSMDNKLKYSGWTFSISVCPLPPLPKINQLSEYIMPYIGISYQSSELGYGKLDTDFKKTAFNLHSSYINSSAWTWKVGCIFYLKKVPFSFIIDYEQSWKSKNDVVKFNNINFGICIDLMQYHYKDRIKTYLPH